MWEQLWSPSCLPQVGRVRARVESRLQRDLRGGGSGLDLSTSEEPVVMAMFYSFSVAITECHILGNL